MHRVIEDEFQAADVTAIHPSRLGEVAVVSNWGLFVYEPPGYMRVAVIRSGPQTVLSMMYPLAGLVYLVIDGLLIFSKTRQCLHDRLARTVVILGTREWWTRSSTR